MGQVGAHREEELLTAERAADWLQRLETGDLKERAAFMAWLKESPRHVREILLAATWDKALDELDPQRRIDIDALMAKASDAVALEPKRLAHPGGSSRVPRPYRWRKRLAASVAILALASVWVFQMYAHTYATSIGEQRAVELDDGSVIHLNARTKVRVNFSDDEREVLLLEGQAIFNVRHEAARPFRVYADRASIQALGTQFDVSRRRGRTTVAVIEGRVRVSAEGGQPLAGGVHPKNATTLAAGESASIIAGESAHERITAPTAINVAEITAWRQRRLVFRKDTLADMAAEFNRYNRSPQIRVEGQALQARPFNGVFDADDPGSLIRFLEEMNGIVVTKDGSDVVIRTRDSGADASRN